jgi:hypothetical protein
MLRASSLIGLMMLAAGAAYGGETGGEHPLAPLVKYASERYRYIDEYVKDYTCTLVKRERIDGRLSDYEFLFMKLRHARVEQGKAVTPFSVYVRFLSPPQLRDREALYVEGRNEGKIVARRGGLRLPYVTAAVDPNGELAMQGNHYPLTEIGFKTLLQRLIEVAREDMHYGECEVKYFPGAKVNGRAATMIQVTHPVRRPHFLYHVARIFVDDELQLPIRYAAYDWPEESGGEPRLIEEYTYLDLKLNVGLTDSDFDHRNESYLFRRDFEVH